MCTEQYNFDIGEITAPFGLRGEVKVWPLTDFPEHFEQLEEVCLAWKDGHSRISRIERAWHHKKFVILKFEGIDDISAAETLRGARIRIPESQLMPLQEGEYYIHDIIGMDVVTSEGEHLGKVTEVLRSPANDVYVTEKAMIPAVREFVERIDLPARKIIVRPVKGLLISERPERE